MDRRERAESGQCRMNARMIAPLMEVNFLSCVCFLRSTTLNKVIMLSMRFNDNCSAVEVLICHKNVTVQNE